MLNKVINNLLIELNITGYQYFRPETKLKYRLARGELCINLLYVAYKKCLILHMHETLNI